MWLVKYWDKTAGKETFRNYKWKTEYQVRRITEAMFKQGFVHLTTEKVW